MRYRFRGMYRETARPVHGHVEALDDEAAYQVLSDNGILTETLRADPVVPATTAPATDPVSQFTDALENALNWSSSQVAFDDLSKRYRGKKVWVVDREKIRHRVSEVVDMTLAASEADRDSGAAARERVANAISGLFHDNRNIASQHDAETVAQMRAMLAAAGVGASSAGDTGPGLAEQIGRLTGVVEQAERLISAMQSALRNVERGGAGTARRQLVGSVNQANGEQNHVLQEIFQSNLELRRAIAAPAARPAAAATAVAAPAPGRPIAPAPRAVVAQATN